MILKKAMDDYKIIVEQEHQTVMAHYEVGAKPDGGYQSEAKLEHDLIKQLQSQGYEYVQVKDDMTGTWYLSYFGNAYKEGELERESTCKEYLQVQQEGKRKVSRKVKYYDLDVIISVGYRYDRYLSY
jgi:hypothetical protein